MIGAWALYWLIFVLPLVGGFVSLWSLHGITAAQDAIKHLQSDWKTIEDEAQRREKSLPPLPGITGGGVPGITGGDESQAHLRGFEGPLWFNRVFMIAWCALFVSTAAICLYFVLTGRSLWHGLLPVLSLPR